jgi:hypothetical protein
LFTFVASSEQPSLKLSRAAVHRHLQSADDAAIAQFDFEFIMFDELIQ